MHAFDGGAFDDVAFDVGGITPPVVTGGYAAANMFTFPPVKQDDDELLLAAWFMFMRQPYEN
jgi:hypothetical protein